MSASIVVLLICFAGLITAIVMKPEMFLSLSYPASNGAGTEAADISIDVSKEALSAASLASPSSTSSPVDERVFRKCRS